jgi:hypothetical protein
MAGTPYLVDSNLQIDVYGWIRVLPQEPFFQ